MVGYDPTIKSLPPSSATSLSIPTSTKASSSSSSESSEAAHPHHRHSAVAGFSSGCMTRFLCHPLDVLKIRFQLQIEPISRASSVSKYRTVSQTFSCIVREESMAALWKGHVSGQILSGIYGCAYFSSLELFTQLAWSLILSDSPSDYQSSANASLTTNNWTPATVNFFCGSLSGFTATALSHPFDVIRTRIISQSETPKTYLNTRHALRTILAREGVAGLYRGFLPTTLQIMPFSGAQFAAYKLLKRLWHEHLGEDTLLLEVPLTAGALHLHLQSSFLCGAGSGMVAKFLVYPLDLIRKRLQIRGFEAARGQAFGSVPVYQGFIHCIVTTLEKESVTAFYKGLVPSLFKATLTTALNFWLYESVLAMMLNAESR